MKKTQLSILTIISLLLINGCSYKNKNIKVFSNIRQFDINQTYSNKTITSEEIQINQKLKEKPNTQNQEKITPPIIKTNSIKIYKRYKLLLSKTSNKKEISINVENIPIPEFIKLVFGQILHYNYFISQNVEKNKNKITLKINEKISKEEFLNIVQNILNENNIKIIKKDNIYYFKKGKNEKINKLSNYIIYGRQIPNTINDNTIITLIVPFYYIDPSKIEWMLKKFYLSNAYIVTIRKQQIMFITAQAKYIKEALQFINMMDNPTLRKKYSTLLKLKYIDVNDFTNRIKTILKSSGVPIAKNLKQSGVLITPIPELNSLLLIYDKKEWFKIIEFWKNKLDMLNINSEKPQIFIYKPQNRDSKELVTLIKKLFTKINTSNKKNKKNILQVINDNTRNILIIYTTPSIYKKIYDMLQRLDTLPKQVLIQVTIAEITLKDSLQYGFEWFLQHNKKFSYSIGTLGNLGIGGGGLVGTIINNDKTFQSILNFLAQKNLINILSSPKLIVLDNQSANINVGTQVPVLTSSTKTSNTDNTTQITQSVKYRNTGIILNVKPIVHSNGALTLQISQTVSDPQPNNTSDISSPIILNRSITTKVVLKSNQELLLGGLIRETTGKTINKVPILGDIPIIGNLFKTVSYSKDKTELIIIVKPIIISNTKEADIITHNFKQLLQEQNDQ
jgi:general secretion pathway protein D